HQDLQGHAARRPADYARRAGRPRPAHDEGRHGEGHAHAPRRSLARAWPGKERKKEKEAVESSTARFQDKSGGPTDPTRRNQERGPGILHPVAIPPQQENIPEWQSVSDS